MEAHTAPFVSPYRLIMVLRWDFAGTYGTVMDSHIVRPSTETWCLPWNLDGNIVVPWYFHGASMMLAWDFRIHPCDSDGLQRDWHGLRRYYQQRVVCFRVIPGTS